MVTGLNVCQNAVALMQPPPMPQQRAERELKDDDAPPPSQSQAYLSGLRGYDQSQPAILQFRAVEKMENWGRRRAREEYARLIMAYVEDFNSYYGTDEDDIAVWRRLLPVMHVDPVPKSVEECKEVSMQQSNGRMDFQAH
jgi:hypothetical protein